MNYVDPSRKSRSRRLTGSYTATAIVALVASLCTIGCHAVTLYVPGSDPETVKGDLMEAKYLRGETHCYASLLAVQGGWQGWKERYFSKDGLLGLQVVLRIPTSLNEADMRLTVPDQAEGYVLVHSALGIGEAWRIAGGTISAKSTEEGQEVEVDVTLDRIYPSVRASARQAEAAGERLVIRRSVLRADPGVPANIFTSQNTRVAPGLLAWQAPSTEAPR